MNITDTDPLMKTKRELLIHELREGKREKGRGKLCAASSRYDRKTHEYVTDWAHTFWCCIGVGCNLIGYTARELTEELDGYYRNFRLEYGVTDKQIKYLMAMNDGEAMRWTPNEEFSGSYMSDAPVIRAKAPDREFPFIARFLELVWGM